MARRHPLAGSVRTRALAPFGVEVELDLSGPVPPDTQAALAELWDLHQLVVFRDQRLRLDDQERVAAWFGPVLRSDSSYISTDVGLGALGRDPLVFHSDLACTPYPLLGLSLHAVDVVDDETSTRFANAVLAARDLPAPLRARLGGLHAVHLWPTSVTERQRSASVEDGWPGSVHPVLMTHPRTGEPLVYVSAAQTDRIVELDGDDGEALIQALYEVLYAEGNVYEHRWRRGDLVVWDNLALQHGRADLGASGTRTLQRVSIATHSYMDLMPPQLAAVYGISPEIVAAGKTEL